MRPMNSTVIISVESRKGGVGKTTASITLGEQLIEKGYQVLLLDMDLTGTRLSPEFLSNRSSSLFVVSQNGKDVNLVDLYKDVFLEGKRVPPFSFDKTDWHYLHICKGKCNYLESDIYKISADSTEQLAPIEDPRVLYDSYHAYWMRQMIEVLTLQFEACLRGTKGVVILDCSPGVSAMEVMIHDYLTTLGPDIGKFLYVTSLDEQDLLACRQSCRQIDGIMRDKMDAGKYYQSLKHERMKDRIEIALRSDSFRDVWRRLCESGGTIPQFYGSNVDLPDRSSYSALLINKVPRHLVEQVRSSVAAPDDVYVPFLSHLSSLFVNESLLQGHSEIARLNIEDVALKGELSTLVEDDKRFWAFVSVNSGDVTSALFDELWAPMWPFIEIKKYYEDRLGREIKDIRAAVDEALSKYNGVSDLFENEIMCVRALVLRIIGDTKENRHEIDSVFMLVSRMLMDAGEENPVSFHLDNMSQHSIEKLVYLFGVAVYRLHYYRDFCGRITQLMRLALDGKNELEKLDIINLRETLTSLMEGRRRVNQDFDRLWEGLLSGPINAYEMQLSLHSVLNRWGL